MPKSNQSESFFKKCDNKLDLLSDEVGNLLVNIFHQLALFAIGAATIWAAMRAFLGMVEAGHASIEDLLLLFIYLEYRCHGRHLFQNQTYAGAVFDLCGNYRPYQIVDLAGQPS